MGPTLASDSFLTINDLFLKTRPHPDSSASSSSSRHSPNHGRILSFTGQVIYTLSNTSHTIVNPADRNTLSLPSSHDLDRFPLHKQARWLFRKKSNGHSLDHIVWLRDPRPSSLAGSTRPAINPKQHSAAIPKDEPARKVDTLTENHSFGNGMHVKVQEPNDRVLLILDSDDEENEKHLKRGKQHQQAQEPKKESSNKDGTYSDTGDHSSVISWSDSNASSSESDTDDDLEEQNIPERVVAVLLSDAFDQNRINRVESLSISAINPGDQLFVTDALVLVDEFDSNMVLSCVGIPDKTKFLIMPASPSKEAKRTKLIKAQGGGMKRPRTEQSSQGVQVIDLFASGQRQQQQRNEGSKKRISVSSPSPDTPMNRGINSEGVKKVCQETTRSGRHSTPALNFRQRQDRARGLNALDLLVPTIHNRHNGDPNCRVNKDKTSKVDYFSTLWCEAPITAATSVHPRSEAPTTSDSSNSRTGSHNASGSTRTITRHICWLTRIDRALLRAICAECSNVYKNLECVFGCQSRKWRLDIQMECSVSDGTAEVQLLVLKDLQDVMWTLLGVMKKATDEPSGQVGSSLDIASGATEHKCREDANGASLGGLVNHTNSALTSSQFTDAYQDVRNKVLRIVARRGELSFRTGPLLPKTINNQKGGSKSAIKPMSGQISLPSVTSVGGFVESIDQDESHRAKAEEKLWLDICSGRPRTRDKFLLHATTAPGLGAPAQSLTVAGSSSAVTPAVSTATGGKNTQLRTSFVKMNRHTTIMTLVRPPLVLRAVDVERIGSQTEAMILMEQLQNASL